MVSISRAAEAILRRASEIIGFRNEDVLSDSDMNHQPRILRWKDLGLWCVVVDSGVVLYDVPRLRRG